MNHRRLRNPGWSAWLLWLVATVTGYAPATFITLTILDAIVVPSGTSPPSGITLIASFATWAALTGALTGAFQAIVLRLYVSNFAWGRWVLFTSIGLVAGTTLISLLQGIFMSAGEALNFVYLSCYLSVLIGMAGTLAGWAQRHVLNDYLEDDGLWMWLTGASAAIGTFLAMVFFVASSSQGSSFIIDYVALGAVVFAAVGFGMGILLHRILREHYLTLEERS